MSHQRVNLSVDQLRCDVQSESGGCEPYLWTTFFALGASGSEPGQLQVVSPTHPDIRGAFADDVDTGQTLSVPEQVGSASFTFDADAGQGLVGIAAMVLDEDESRSEAVEAAQGAYAEAVEQQLRSYLERHGANAPEQPSDSDLEEIRSAVLSRMRAAIHGTYNYSDLFTDQDDHLGFGLRLFRADQAAGDFELQLNGAHDRFALQGSVRTEGAQVSAA